MPVLLGTDAEKLEMPANIVSWQNDPFYDYIPWQRTSANIGDNPASWIPVVKTLTEDQPVADAMRTGEASDGDLSGAAEALGVSSRRADSAITAERP